MVGDACLGVGFPVGPDIPVEHNIPVGPEFPVGVFFPADLPGAGENTGVEGSRRPLSVCE